jgi:hypothetical protein
MFANKLVLHLSSQCALVCMAKPLSFHTNDKRPCLIAPSSGSKKKNYDMVNALAYYTGINGPHKSFKMNPPGPNVIKFYTAVIFVSYYWLKHLNLAGFSA